MAKVVKITESKLVELIEGIVTQKVSEEKKVWLKEHAETKKTVLENKVAQLEAKIAKFIK
jgi:hypothetical protein|tara:strand:+ start:392 stop:571 length:180 start_codon:yes stop_codon:yes gene_type:complete